MPLLPPQKRPPTSVKPLPLSHEGPAYTVVPLDVTPSGVTQPLVEILWERVPDNVVRSSRCASPSDVVILWVVQIEDLGADYQVKLLRLHYSRAQDATVGD
ncbi:hypothetical protein E2562_011183 [Oryza meyeriana var. granulata]|uniref:Uncharacterized protein n=1 Tax=Oryza meyeriana var. granulata TaxID=110450 RepID=A0A6G1DFF8_9ORYZ|nr:hypothetical protein E2562_011183 [Oryza meyeriana var. granulata]